MREIIDQAGKGNDRAKLAIDTFCYRIKKYIGAYAAVLGSVDAIVFTGGIGENASLIRERSCEGLEHLGIAIDAAKNEAAMGNIAEIQKDDAPVRFSRYGTDEEREIAQTDRSCHREGKVSGKSLVHGFFVVNYVKADMLTSLRSYGA